MRKNLIFLLIAVIFGANTAFAANKQLVLQLGENLTKVESSIKLTKTKIQTSKEIQFLPELYLSLAELLIEKSRIKYEIKMEEAGGKTAAQLDFTAEKLLKAEAIEALTQIEDRYPEYEGLDRVIFAIAHEYKEMGEDDQAMKAYKRLVDKFPNSAFWADAQYGIGNIYYDRKDYEFALQQYKRIIEKQPSVMTLMAHYKMGLCYLHMDKSLSSVKEFEAVLESKLVFETDKVPQDFKRKDVREEALVASVKPISDLSSEELRRNPKYRYPLDYYKALAPNRAAYRSVLARLNKRLSLKARHHEAAQASFELIKVAADLNQAKEALESYYFAMKKAKRTDYDFVAPKIVSELLWKLKNDGKKGEFRKYEPVLRDISTSLHKAALKTKRPDDLNQSIEGYRDYLWIFPNSKFNSEITLNMAEAAFHAGRFVEAGLWYKQLALKPTTAKPSRDFFMSAFESFNQAFKEQARLNILDKTQGRAAYFVLASNFEKRFSQDPAMSSVLYNLAKSLYDGQDYVEAEKRLERFLRRYPADKNAQAAAVLILDCYYLRGDLQGLMAKGNKLLALPLSPSSKKEIQVVMQSSALKRVRSIAGDFASSSYADEFLKFAQQSGKSPLGETSLLEAFVSLKAGQDTKAFKVGEQFLGQYGESPKAKDVLSNLIQLALASSDFMTAAKYLAAFSQKYPTDDSSSKFAMTAAQLYASLGEVNKASRVYLAVRQPEQAASVLFKNQRWSDLVEVAPKVPGITGLYYQGVGHYRLGKVDAGLQLLERVFQQEASDETGREFKAHAGYLLAVREFERYRSVSSSGISSTASIKQKAAALNEVDKVIWKVLETGVGKWVIASLQMQAVLYRNYAQFLKAGPAPQPLTTAQYAKLVSPQIATYLKSADEISQKCSVSAEDYEVVNEFVAGCRTRSVALIREKNEPMPSRRPARVGAYSGIQARLLKDSENVKILDELGQAAIRGGDFLQANAVYSRILEIKQNDGNAFAQLGVINLFHSKWDQSVYFFKKSVENEPKNSTALWGLASLYNKFGHKKKFAETVQKAKSAGRPKGVVHPIMRL